MKIVSSPVHPETPSHFGAMYQTPFASDWRDALFQNYDKMLSTGTFSAPILRTSIPPHKSILQPRVACRVKDTLIPHQYDLYARTCADGSTQRENVDYTGSYSLVASIDSILSPTEFSCRFGSFNQHLGHFQRFSKQYYF